MSELIDEEVIAGRLYTGPQYTKYNGVLRQLGDIRDELGAGNNTSPLTMNALLVYPWLLTLLPPHPSPAPTPGPSALDPRPIGYNRHQSLQQAVFGLSTTTSQFGWAGVGDGRCGIWLRCIG